MGPNFICKLLTTLLRGRGDLRMRKTHDKSEQQQARRGRHAQFKSTTCLAPTLASGRHKKTEGDPPRGDIAQVTPPLI